MSSNPKVPTDGSKTVRKSDLMKMLRDEHGISKRKAAAAVNAVFDQMARALRRGEEVELPIGWIQAVQRPPGRKPRVIQRFRNIQSGKIDFKYTRQPQRIIRFRRTPGLIFRGAEAYSSPVGDTELSRQGEEVARLFTKFTGRELTMPELQALMAATVDFNKTAGTPAEIMPRLLARLRQIDREQRSFSGLADLADLVSRLIWIR